MRTYKIPKFFMTGISFLKTSKENFKVKKGIYFDLNGPKVKGNIIFLEKYN